MPPHTAQTPSTILIVDDVPSNLSVAMAALEAEGFRVIVAQDGDEGLRRADFAQPDQILLDVMMPGPGGFEICRSLKLNARTRDIPVIFMTALTGAENKLSGFKAGGVDYVTKPLQIEELIVRINTHLKLSHMHKQLAEQNLQLQSYRGELEQMVAERTAELGDTNRKLHEEVNDRKRAEDALASREREFRTLVENAPNMIVRYDTDFRRIFINPSYERFTGIPLQAAWNKTPDDIWKPILPPTEYKARLQKVMDSGTPDHILLEWYESDGRLSSHLMHAIAEYDECGKAIGTLVIGHNITELKMTQTQLEESRTQLRALVAQREKAREDERKRISREMHDELGQRLTALRMNLSSLRIRFCSDNDALLAHVQSMTAAVDSTIEVVRSVASRLRPAPLDMGIVPAMEWLAEDFTSRSGIECDLRLGNEVTLDDNQATAVFRIVQESLTNIQRHAQASSVRVLLDKNNENHILEIQDNGKGFDPDIQKKTFGLVGIEERVLMMGGTLIIDSAPGQGVKTVVHIPAAQGVKG